MHFRITSPQHTQVFVLKFSFQKFLMKLMLKISSMVLNFKFQLLWIWISNAGRQNLFQKWSDHSTVSVSCLCPIPVFHFMEIFEDLADNTHRVFASHYEGINEDLYPPRNSTQQPLEVTSRFVPGYTHSSKNCYKMYYGKFVLPWKIHWYFLLWQINAMLFQGYFWYEVHTDITSNIIECD